MVNQKEKRLKSSLVNVRKTIANKFKKLHRDRIARERELTEKYAPITDSIKKIIETKKNIQNETSRIVENDDEQEEEQEQQQQEEDHYEDDDYGDQMRLLQPINHRYYAENDEAPENNNYFNNIIDENDNNNNNNEIVDMSFENADEMVVPQQRRIERRRRRIDHDEIILRHNQRMQNGNRKRDRDVQHDFDDDEIAHQRRTSIKRKRLLTVAANANRSIDLRAALKNVQRTKKVTASMLRKKIVKPEGDLLLQARKGRFTFTDGIVKNHFAKKRINQVKLRDGSGLLEEKFIPYTQNITYEYYDDPNELVDRLRLLMASKSAGNSNHAQEINSILEELRERKIIE